MVIPRYPGWPVTFWRNQFLSRVVQCFPMVVPCFLMVFQCVPMLSYQSHLFWWISGCCETNARALFEKGQSTVQRWDAPEVSSCNTCGWLQTSTLPWFFHRIHMGKPCWFPKSRYVHRCFTDVSLRWFMAKPLNSFTHPGYLVPQCYPVLPPPSGLIQLGSCSGIAITSPSWSWTSSTSWTSRGQRRTACLHQISNFKLENMYNMYTLYTRSMYVYIYIYIYIVYRYTYIYIYIYMKHDDWCHESGSRPYHGLAASPAQLDALVEDLIIKAVQ